MLGGYPWEGGRLSIYVSWIPLVMTVVLGFRGGGFETHPSDRPRWHKYLAYGLIPILSIFASAYRPATIQWWIEVLLLGAFIWTLIRQVGREDLTRWIIYAIVPQAVLGIVQYLAQFVHGSAWLGIAEQNPLTRGVSVIESGGVRWLRAYGGFPHPNIFGGWLVLGLSILMGMRRVVRPCLEKIATVVFSIALVLSFSRSAWLAAIILVLASSYQMVRFHSREERLHFFKTVGFMICAAGITAVLCAPLIQTRAVTKTTLETRSLSEREQGWQNGVELFKRHPRIGVGPRVVNRALQEEGIVPSSTIPVPPHNVFLLLLTEVGIGGAFLLLGGCFLIYKETRGIRSGNATYPVFLAFLPILSLDHYLWSTWAGLSCVELIFIYTLSKSEYSPK